MKCTQILLYLRKRRTGNVIKLRPRRRGKSLLPFLFILIVGAFLGASEQLPIDVMLREMERSFQKWRPSENSKYITCRDLFAVDGDTIKCNGENMRALGDGSPNWSGFDTPEIFKPNCRKELELGRAAKARMQELLWQHVRVRDSGARDRYQRPLVWVEIGSRTAGSILVEEGHARIWKPGVKHDWCN